MGANTRHFKALMKKNLINWKRTPLSSVLEIICPCALMLLLAVFRASIEAEFVTDLSLFSIRHPLYTPGGPNEQD